MLELVVDTNIIVPPVSRRAMARLYIAPLPLRLLCWVSLRSTQPTKVTFWITKVTF
jgi:hypothetical protein